MALHRTTGRWQLGIALTMVAVVLWGGLPLVLQVLLKGLDPFTITWFRFTVAAVAVGGYLAYRRRLPRVNRLGPLEWLLVAVAIGGLNGNYICYLLSLQYISAGTAQVVFQVSPFFMAMGGLVVFGERFVRRQWLGLICLAVGFALFFEGRYAQFFSELESDGAIGIALIIAAALTWGFYALAQKQLLETLTPAGIMILLYIGGVALFLPPAEPATLEGLGAAEWTLLFYAALNTIVAYGCVSEALRHLEASRVSAVIAINPLLTLVFATVGSRLLPEYIMAEELTVARVIGAVVVVSGAALVALSR